MKNKPTVHYRGSCDFINRFDDGQVASVFALDHPKLGQKWAITSEVQKKLPDGVFETLNTIYVPVKDNNDDTID